MGEPRPPEPVLLVCGMLAGREAWLDQAAARLAERFGPVGLASETFPFDFTTYYEREMGPGLLRRFVAFERLIDPGDLAAVKLATNEIERVFAGERKSGLVQPTRKKGSGTLPSRSPTPFPGAEETPAPFFPARPVNLDPGTVNGSQLVLASTKPHAHRIYLRDGVYAEVTLLYRGGRWATCPWTYPDYASSRYDGFLDAARKRYLKRRRASGAEEAPA